MQLITNEVRQALQPLYTFEDTKPEDILVKVHFFTPDSSWDWFPYEWDGNDLMFGFVSGHYPALGYFSLSELQGVRGPYGLAIEREFAFEPVPLNILMDRYKIR